MFPITLSIHLTWTERDQLKSVNKIMSTENEFSCPNSIWNNYFALKKKKKFLFTEYIFEKLS